MQVSRKPANHEVIESTKGMAAAQSPLAVQANVEAFRRGGNAVDAAVTSA